MHITWNWWNHNLQLVTNPPLNTPFAVFSKLLLFGFYWWNRWSPLWNARDIRPQQSNNLGWGPILVQVTGFSVTTTTSSFSNSILNAKSDFDDSGSTSQQEYDPDFERFESLVQAQCTTHPSHFKLNNNQHTNQQSSSSQQIRVRLMISSLLWKETWDNPPG